ncbi:MAG: hypothetical protein IPF66_08965 [Holophagales bacterium]|nr:hypothetical protein [Holophagales bacterium]
MRASGRRLASRPGRGRLVPQGRDPHRRQERHSPARNGRLKGAPPVSFVLVLHGHIPAVLGHGVWPHGADWLHEAAAETYLPFVAAARALDADGVPWKATVGLTPILCEQLRDARFARGFRRYVRHRLAAAGRDAREFARAGHEAEPLARAWRAHYEEALALFDALDGDLVAPFARLADEGKVEPIACAATHGFLPLLPSDAAAERQLDVGLAAHRRHFGRPARGLWMPECATRPAGTLVTPGFGRRVLRDGTFFRSWRRAT